MVVKSKEEVAEIREGLNSRMAAAFTDGFLFTLSIGKQTWTISPTPDDFGLKEFPSIFKPGRMVMLPEKAIQTVDRLEGSARRFLDSRSFHFGEDKRSGFRFVRLKFAVGVDLELRNRRTEFFKAVETLIDGLPGFKAEMRELYLKHWEHLKQLYPDTAEVQDNYLKREEHWERLAKFYPTAEEVRKRYRFTFGLHKMAFPDQFETASFQQLVRENEHDQEYLEHVELMKAESKRRIETEVTHFMQETVRTTRGEVVKVFQDMLAKVNSAKPLSKENVTKLKDVMANVRDMTVGFLDDADFTRQLERVENQLEGKEEFKEGTAASQALGTLFGDAIKQITSTTESAAIAVTETYFSRKLNLT